MYNPVIYDAIMSTEDLGHWKCHHNIPITNSIITTPPLYLQNILKGDDNSIIFKRLFP